ncbi:MAG: FCD domain-containing protein [Paracoccaceae bacterium]
MNVFRPNLASRELLAGWLAKNGTMPGERLPPERQLSEKLGISRGELRKAMTALEVEGLVERHVGRGTFLKVPSAPEPNDESLIARLSEDTSPHNAMMARLSLEPEIAGHAAIHASQRHLVEARNLTNEMRVANSWEEYGNLDARLHELIAIASGNPLLVEMHRIVNAVRLSVVWSGLKIPQSGPPKNYHSFAEHDEIVSALEKRDRSAARSAMRNHLKSVRSNLLKDD